MELFEIKGESYTRRQLVREFGKAKAQEIWDRVGEAFTFSMNGTNIYVYGDILDD